MEISLEFLKTRKRGREVHRHWPDEVKAKIVSGSLRPGTISEMRAFFTRPAPVTAFGGQKSCHSSLFIAEFPPTAAATRLTSRRAGEGTRAAVGVTTD